MELAARETYFTGEAEEPAAVSFIKEIESERIKHPLKLRRNEAALMILDMQNFFFTPGSHARVPSAPMIVGRILKLRQTCTRLGIPVFFTRHLNTPDDAGQMNRWWRDILEDGQPMSELIAEFSDVNNRVIAKSRYSAFYRTDLERILRDRGISQLIITGVMTHLCCETTARDAFIRDFDVFFGIDLTATYNRTLHLSSLRNLAHGFALPVTGDEILGMLGRE